MSSRDSNRLGADEAPGLSVFRPKWLEDGARAEALAADWLAEKGYNLIARGWRPLGPRAEVDIVAEMGDTIVFVEVRYRRDASWGEPFETVGAAKQRRIVKAAMEFLTKLKRADRNIRFDVVSITGGPMGPTIAHIEDAFDADIGGDYAPYL